MSRGARRPETLSPAEAVARIQVPGADEALSPLCGAGVLVVDLERSAGETPDPPAVARARARLGTLPCPTVGIGVGRSSTLGRALAPDLDVALEDVAELDGVLEAVARTPLASLALVQLLRLGSQLDFRDPQGDIHRGLVAESLVYSTLQAGPEYAAWRASRAAPSPSPPEERSVRIEREEARLCLTLDRPERHNAYNVAMRDALVAGLEVAAADPSIEEVVLRGEGPSFCSGGDLDEFGLSADPATAHAVRCTRHPARAIAACPGRVRAELHGACIGAGVELAAFCDHVVAAPDAFFVLPEVGMGLVPGAGGSVSLPRRIGRQRTAWMALTGQRIDASTALRWGIVDAVESDPEVRR